MAIGGYFGLELNQGSEFHPGAIRLNTGRNALEYILRAKGYKKIYLPYFTCDALFEPIEKLHLEIEFYPIDETFYPIFDFKRVKPAEIFLYTNYFGLYDRHVIEITKHTKNILIDNAQAFYSKPLPGIDTFYSPRKFFGLPDGAYLFTNKILNQNLEQDISYKRFEHLVGRVDSGAEEHFQTYRLNSESLSNQPIKQMSNLTYQLLNSIDYQHIAEKRVYNFNYIHEQLKKSNQLTLEIEKSAVPMVYPYLPQNGNEIKKKLIQNKIFVATYWPNVITRADKDSYSHYLTNNLVAIPIDQRYNQDDMNKIIEHLK